MPEAPSIHYLAGKLEPFVGKKVIDAGGYGKLDAEWIIGQKLTRISVHGKYLFFHFPKGIVRMHLGLFGSVEINARKKVNAKFFLHFKEGEINGYVVNVKIMDGKVEDEFDARTDIMGKDFDAKFVQSKIKEAGHKQIEALLMDQDIFSGVGNKIRNEALYMARIHPESYADKIPAARIRKLIEAAQQYAGIFYKNLVTTGKNKEFSVYKRDADPDGNPVTEKYLTPSKRKIYFSKVQKLYH